MMGHSKEIITMDVYGDNKGILLDGVPEIEEFIKELKLENEGSDDRDAVAYICRKIYEEQGVDYFPEPIELVDEDTYSRLLAGYEKCMKQ